MKIRPFVLAFCALVFIPIVALALSSQRAQIGVTILVNVTANPLGYNPSSRTGAIGAIVAHETLRAAPPAIERAFEAQELHFLPPSSGMTVAQVQKSLRVDADVTPNPTATLLTSNASGGTAIVNVEAGIPTAFQCVYQVSVDTAVASWQIKYGLAQNYTGTGSATFVGGASSSNMYNSGVVAPPAPPVPTESPIPTSTPFLVYSTDGNAWAQHGGNFGGSQTFCVDLVFNIPIATAAGQYTDNAIYTLYY